MASKRTLSGDYRKPTSVTSELWIWQVSPRYGAHEKTVGKWLVFKNKENGDLDRTWETIRCAVESDELGSPIAYCSTAKCDNDYDEIKKEGVICVYTTAETMDEVGLKLIPLVQQTIRYKTHEATRAGRYTSRGHGKVCIRVLYWNDGKPKFSD